jgi:hypothetical protein
VLAQRKRVAAMFKDSITGSLTGRVRLVGVAVVLGG